MITQTIVMLSQQGTYAQNTAQFSLNNSTNWRTCGHQYIFEIALLSEDFQYNMIS